MMEMIPIMSCNSVTGEVKAMIFSKKGMATKAMIKNVRSGNIVNLKKQIKKGTVTFINKQ